MCGIYGVISLKERNALDINTARKATKILAHRGPDDSGDYDDEHVFLGHTRLSIVDLSTRGKQPMFSADERLVIVYNGEIYNFKELKKELESKGCKFNSGTDTEVLLYLYKDRGKKIVNDLDGMFSFLIWDRDKKEGFIARDRIGKKPFYYTFFDDKFYFASEIKALLVNEELPREVDKEALSGFLAYDYVIPPKTMFKGIFELMPGHYGVYNSKGLKISQYWDLPCYNNFIRGDAKKVDELLKKAVEKRLMGDVPVGIFLSGGLDSSAVLSYVAEVNKEKISSLTMGYNVPEDELKYARIVADKFNTNHHEVILSEDDAINIIPEVVYHLDQPLAESTAVSYHLLAKHIKKYATVVLSGEGSDELFLGYKRHGAMAKLESYRKMSGALKGSSYVFSGLQKVYPNIRSRKYLDYLKEVLASAKDPVQSYMVLNYISFFEDELKKLLKDKECLRHVGYAVGVMRDAFKQRKNLFNKMGYFDYKVWLPGRLLMRIDKPTMASGVETRVPFLDRDLINYSMSIDPRVRLRKKILVAALKDKLPRDVIERKKQGFYFPLNQWFDKRLRECLQNLNEHKLFNNDYIGKLNRKHNQLRNDQKLWNLLIFKVWHEIYINGTDYRKIQM